MTVNIESTLLHVRPVSSDKGSAARMDPKLAASSLRVETLGDVYAALARLGRADRTAVRAVFVCIDVIGAPELEFFAVVRRVARQVKVYVYGDDRCARRLAKAVERGAAGCVTDELIQDLAEINAAPEQTTVPSPPPVTAVAHESASWGGQVVVPPCPEEEVDGSSISPGHAAGECPEIDEEEPSLADESAAPEGVRVPWLRYADRPTRGAPRVDDPAAGPVPAESSRAVTPDMFRSEPLLTEEELQALLGDDIAAIVPAERTPDDLMEMGNEEAPS